MNSDAVDIPEEAEQKRRQAKALRDRAEELESQAYDLTMEQTRQFMRELQDKLLNRSECLEYLPIGTLQSLKNWERKYSPYGYLRFKNNKILRSQLLEFIDDLNSGKINQMINS